VLFPIVWDFRAPAYRTTVGFPLYWYIRRGEERTTIGFPLICHAIFLPIQPLLSPVYSRYYFVDLKKNKKIASN